MPQEGVQYIANFVTWTLDNIECQPLSDPRNAQALPIIMLKYGCTLYSVGGAVLHKVMNISTTFFFWYKRKSRKTEQSQNYTFKYNTQIKAQVRNHCKSIREDFTDIDV